ncbi:MAG TPA: DUF1800 domain-containing protein [Chloroflexota bacterium]
MDAAKAVGLGAALGVALLAAPGGQPGLPLDEGAKVAHLLRRAGFGGSAEELAEYRALGLAGAVARLVDYESVPDDVEEKLLLFYFDAAKLYDAQRRWVLRMLWSRRPLQEKMVLFWHGLLTSANSKVGRPELMQRQNDFFRAHALDDYGTILKGISRDPAMMLFLDTHNSRRAHPNENYARELLELFSTGIGPYGERDVQEAARAFTGWTVPKDGQPVFNQSQFDPGEKQFLGATVRTADEVIDAIVAHPATARFVSAKLFAFFVHPAPDERELEPLARLFGETGGSIRALVRAILSSEAFYSRRAYRARLKSPAEYAVGVLRQLGVPSDGSGVVERMIRMGQNLYNPPNVAGWPGGRSWLNSGTWIERLNYANAATAARGDQGMLSLPLGRYLDERGLRRPDEIVDHFLALLVDGRVGAESRRVLSEHLGPAPTEAQQRGLVYLILAMPEYQLC